MVRRYLDVALASALQGKRRFGVRIACCNGGLVKLDHKFAHLCHLALRRDLHGLERQRHIASHYAGQQQHAHWPTQAASC